MNRATRRKWILAVPLLVGCNAAVGGLGELGALGEPIAGATQSLVVEGCFRADLPDTMTEADVQPFDSAAGQWLDDAITLGYDCGVYDTSYPAEPVSSVDVVVEGHDAVFQRYDLASGQSDRPYEHIIVLHFARPSDNVVTGSEHINISIFVPDESDIPLAQSIIASVHDVWP